MNDQEFLSFVQKYATEIATVLTVTPKVFGDPNRVTIKARYRTLNDVLINTMSGNVEIGEDCMMGHGVMLITGTHNFHKLGDERRTTVPHDGHDIILERGAWVASGAIIMGPARIGENAVIAAGSIVRGDVPAYAIYAGNPAVKIGDVRNSN